MYVWREGGDSICMLCISFTITVSVCNLGLKIFVITCLSIVFIVFISLNKQHLHQTLYYQ